jgi:hypothetical protein
MAMSGSTLPHVGGPKNLTELYASLANSGSWAAIGDAELVANSWATDGSSDGPMSLGWEEHIRRAESAPVRCAAAIGALATGIAADQHGAKAAWNNPSVGLFPRSRLFASFLHNLNCNTRGAGQAPTVYMVTNYWDARTPRLRASTTPSADLTRFTKENGGNGPLADAVRANSELYLTDEPSTIRAYCGSALRHMLARDYQLGPPDDRFLRVDSRWAIIDKMGPMSGRVRDVHLGQFMIACYELRATLPKGVSLAKVLNPRVYRTYKAILDGPAINYPVPETASGISIPSPTVVKKSPFDVTELLKNFRPAEGQQRYAVTQRPRLEIAPMGRLPGASVRGADSAAHETGGRVADRVAASIGRITCAEARRLARAGGAADLDDCRETAAAVAAENAKLRTRRRAVITAMETQYYARHPYLHPQAVAATRENHNQFMERAFAPARANDMLASYATRPDVSDGEWLSLYAAASLGSREEQVAANKLSEQRKNALKAYILDNIQIIGNRPQLPQGVTHQDLADFGIRIAELDHDLPMHLYVPAALAVLDNDSSLFHERAPGFVERIIAGDRRTPEEEKQNRNNTILLDTILFHEASLQYGVKMGHPEVKAYDTELSKLLIACRLADSLAPIAAQHPRVHAVIAKRLGPILRSIDVDVLSGYLDQRIPDPVLDIRDFYVGLYGTLQASDQRTAA